MLPPVVVFLAPGFIVSAVLSWVFDITPQGIKRTANSSPDEAVDIVRQLEAQAGREFLRGYLSGNDYAGFGDETKAIEHLKREYLNHPCINYNDIDRTGMSVDAMLASWGNTRFAALAAKPE